MKFLRTDRETVLLSCETDLLSIGIIMENTGTDRHASVIERNVRTVKDHQRATLASLPYKLPLALYPYLLDDVIGCLNSVTNKKSNPLSPQEWITGRKSQVLLLKQSIGTYGIAHIAKGTRKDNMSRGVHSVIVGRDLNSKNSFKVYMLSTSTVIHTDKFVELPATQDFITMMNTLSQGDPPILDEHYDVEDPPTDFAPQLSDLAAVQALDYVDAERVTQDPTATFCNPLILGSKLQL